MQFTLQNDAGNLVTACTDTEVRVGSEIIRRSAILTVDRIVPDWPPRNAATLQPQDLLPVLELKPDVILLGTGARQRFPNPQVLKTAIAAGVAVEVMDTRAACRTYNVLVQEGRRVAAALLIEAPE